MSGRQIIARNIKYPRPCIDALETLVTDENKRTWTFLTNHSRVLVMISKDPQVRIRDISAMTGITERSAQRIVSELEEAGYLTHERVGRRNHYQVSPEVRLRHPHEQDIEVGLLLSLLSDSEAKPHT